MLAAEQYRAKAAEFRGFLTDMPRSPREMSEIRNLEQTYTMLAENEEMAVYVDRTVQRRKNRDNRVVAEDEEQILKCQAAAARKD